MSAPNLAGELVWIDSAELERLKDLETLVRKWKEAKVKSAMAWSKWKEAEGIPEPLEVTEASSHFLAATMELEAWQ